MVTLYFKCTVKVLKADNKPLKAQTNFFFFFYDTLIKHQEIAFNGSALCH